MAAGVPDVQGIDEVDEVVFAQFLLVEVAAWVAAWVDSSPEVVADTDIIWMASQQCQRASGHDWQAMGRVGFVPSERNRASSKRVASAILGVAGQIWRHYAVKKTRHGRG